MNSSSKKSVAIDDGHGENSGGGGGKVRRYSAAEATMAEMSKGTGKKASITRITSGKSVYEIIWEDSSGDGCGNSGSGTTGSGSRSVSV